MPHPGIRRLVGLVATAWVVCLALPGAAGRPSITLLDLDGQPVDPFAARRDAAAVTFIFVSTDCPVSNRYAPEIERLRGRFAERGVAFWLVYPDPGDTPAAIRQHDEEFGHRIPALRDPDQLLVKASGATITPEALVYDPSGRVVYRGRIDNRYVSLGRSRLAPTSHDLEDALDAALDGRPVAEPITQAVGCFIADFAR